MLTVLINAYACSPDMGSEPGMAWNWCVNLANQCKLHIITEGEFRYKIEAVLPTLPQGKNMQFYYNPVSDDIRKMCWNQGDWRFYSHYKEWQHKTLQIAEHIIKEHQTDIIHQLNMVGFREPGYLWKIKDIPYVWGPIGGLKQFPTAYLQEVGLKMSLFYRIKNTLNILQIKYNQRVRQAVLRTDLLIASIPDSYSAIKKYHKKEPVIMSETGCYLQKDSEENIDRFYKATFDIMWVGKFDFRKQLDLALRTVAKIKHLPGIKLSVYGMGSEKQYTHYKKLTEELNINDHIEWCGNIPNNNILEKMKTASLFFFTSVSEETSTVVPEALNCFLPVLCFDACGFGHVIDESVGIKIPFSNPSRSVDEFAEKIEYLYHHRDSLAEKSRNCAHKQEKLSWENKAKQMVELYHQTIENFHRS